MVGGNQTLPVENPGPSENWWLTFPRTRVLPGEEAGIRWT